VIPWDGLLIIIGLEGSPQRGQAIFYGNCMPSQCARRFKILESVGQDDVYDVNSIACWHRAERRDRIWNRFWLTHGMLSTRIADGD